MYEVGAVYSVTNKNKSLEFKFVYSHYVNCMVTM